MKDFMKKMLHYGAELQKAEDAFHCSMIINDAEILYKNEIETLTIQRVSQQRELLKKWWKYFDEESVAVNCNEQEREEVINDFFNCG